MTRFWYTAVLCGALCVLPCHAHPADWRFGHRFILAYTTMNGLGTDGTYAGHVTDYNPPDAVVGTGISLSRRLGNFQLALDYTWRFRFDMDTYVLSNPDNGTTRFRSDLNTETLMLDLHWEILPGHLFNPYLNVAGGRARHTTDTERETYGNGGQRSFAGNRNYSDCLAAGGGVRILLRDDLNLDIAYRYMKLGDPVAGPFADGNELAPDSYYAHDLTVGLQYQF